MGMARVCPGPHLPLAAYHLLFDAIKSNNAADVQQVLQTLGPSALCGHFVFPKSPVSHVTQGLYQVQLPLALAVVTAVAGGGGGPGGGSVRALLAAGVSPLLAVDCDGNNVLHSLAAFLFHQPRAPAPPPPAAAGVAGSSVLEQYALIVASCDEDTVRAMLQHENNLGLRPLEFAAQNGQAHLIHAIMTPARMRSTGIHCHKYYDVTDYEAQQGSRRQFSPVAFLATLDSTHSANVIEFMKQPWFHSWQMAKIKSHIPLLVIWFVLRMSFISAYFVFESDMTDLALDANNTVCRDDAINIHPTAKLLLAIFLQVYGWLGIIIHCSEGVVYAYRLYCKHFALYNIAGKRAFGTQIVTYRIGIVMLYILALVKTTIYLTESPSSSWADILNVLSVLDPIVIPICILYFVQMLPTLGIFVISMYYITFILCAFFVVYIILLIPNVIMIRNFIYINSQEGCIEGFVHFLESAYSTFQVMLNMQNPRDINVNNAYILHIGHFMFTFLVSITLLNLFIAMTCNCITSINMMEVEALMFQRLTVVGLLESRWRWLLGSYYTYMNKRCFYVEKDRIYIVDTVIDVGK